MQSEKLLSSSYVDNAEDISYVDDISIGDYMYKEVTVENKHMFSKQIVKMYRVYKVESTTDSMIELALITKKIKEIPKTKQELQECTNSFEAYDNHIVHKRDKAQLHKLIL